jgi:hypothetical protein
VQGEFYIVNNPLSLKTARDSITEAYERDNYARVKIDSGKRTMPQNALKSVWYKDIADFRGDVTSKDVERECKLNYGVPILRRDPFRDLLFSVIDRFDSSMMYKTSKGELTGLEIKHQSMDSFAVTSIMSVKEKKEYLNCLQSDYPFLSNEV